MRPSAKLRKTDPAAGVDLRPGGLFCFRSSISFARILSHGIRDPRPFRACLRQRLHPLALKAGDDALAAAGTSGFFDSAADMLASGDMMMVSAADGARVLAMAEIGGKIVAAPLG